MRIIARRALRDFWEQHADAEQPLRAWDYDVLRADWKSPADVKSVYASASIVGENRLVFNIGGNNTASSWPSTTSIGCATCDSLDHQAYNRVDVATV